MPKSPFLDLPEPKAYPKPLMGWSIQSKEAFLRWKSNPLTYVPQPDFDASWGQSPKDTWGFKGAYAWMVEQMHQCHLPLPPAGGVLSTPHATQRLPIWFWADAAQLKSSGAPDLRRARRHNEEQVALRLQIPASVALLSDFELWHNTLNYWAFSKSEHHCNVLERFIKAQGTRPFKDPIPWPPKLHELISSSWKSVFCIAPTNAHRQSFTVKIPGARRDWIGDSERRATQGTIFYLDPSWVLDVKNF